MVRFKEIIKILNRVYSSTNTEAVMYNLGNKNIDILKQGYIRQLNESDFLSAFEFNCLCNIFRVLDINYITIGG